MEGKCIKEVGQGVAGGKICMCTDIRRGCLVLSGGQSLLCMDREGGKVREIRVPGTGDCMVWCTVRRGMCMWWGMEMSLSVVYRCW